MAKALTTGSRVTCTLQGTATLTSSAKLRVSGNPVLLASEAASWTIANCTQVGTGLTPCTNIITISAGRASKLTAGGNQVLLDSLAATSNGSPENAISATALQTKLNAD